MSADHGVGGNLSIRQAAFIGVGAMVGAGIFALLGAAGEVAGAAVWVSFLCAGAIAALQGYSFAKFGARYPTGAGLLEYVVRAFGNGHLTGVVGWLLLAANAIITAMVAVSFGSYSSAAFADGGRAWTTVFAVLVVVVMAVLNILGAQAVARVRQSWFWSWSASSPSSPSPPSRPSIPVCWPSPGTRRCATSWPASR